MLREFDLRDPFLQDLARIVHESDLEDEWYDAPEASGLDAIVRGKGALLDDDALIEATGPMYDGLLRRRAERRTCGGSD